MTTSNSRFLVFGATGQTGKHFVSLALKEGHTVRALIRNPRKVAIRNPKLELHEGSIATYTALAELLDGVDFVIAMLGDPKAQQYETVNAAFIERLIPAMRRHHVKRFLYQAGGFTTPYKERLPVMSWILKNTLARYGNLLGQHKDNEAVIKYLVERASDMEWIVHRASIISDARSKGLLVRSKTRFSLATFSDCANYNFRALLDRSAIHTYDLSYYAR